eukprot:TRINITY_DN17402_c0_g1_i1.p1 TRINITY_DN17402_c0_g1~~TRINITY_DN17402_c0_g1_i1.p1  ORF type:complete len:727 (+),score=106.70 TRINITY_DN17402_c0_g1_i1:575-2755(+)
MGAAESTAAFLGGHQELLDKFVGPTPIAYHDTFWEELLAFPYPLPKLKPSDLDSATREACETLGVNDIRTRHLAKLILHMMENLEGAVSTSSNLSGGSTTAPLLEKKQLPLQAINTVYFVRLFMKHLVEQQTGGEIEVHMRLGLSQEEAAAARMSAGDQSILYPFVRALMSFIAHSDVNALSYLLHLEVLNLLLVLSSTQLHSQPGASGPEQHPFLEALMAQGDLAGPFVRKLLLAFVSRLPLPARTPLYSGLPQPPGAGASTSGGMAGTSGGSEQQPLWMLRKVSSAAAAVFLFPFYTYAYLVHSTGIIGIGGGGSGRASPLADNSLLLLLLLVHYGRTSIRADETSDASLTSASDPNDLNSNGDSSEQSAGVPMSASGVDGPGNPFRKALHTAQDTDFSVMRPDSGPESAVRVPFAALYDTLGACLMDDRSTLLLYSLVHGNPAFLEYLLVRADLDTILMPLLAMLYNASRRTPNQIYMLLIILLILSQDASFNANVHKLILPGVPWYKERLLPRISLGSLMVVLLIRTVKFNLSKLRDVYLHTNCLATLANMAPHVHQLNAYASQRLVSLFQMLARKYVRLSHGSQLSSRSQSFESVPGGGVGSAADAPPASAVVNMATGDGSAGGDDEDSATELHIYTDFLRIVLEILNAILTYALPRNPEVVYALLHRQEIFVPFRHHERFYELLENIFTILRQNTGLKEEVWDPSDKLSRTGGSTGSQVT